VTLFGLHVCLLPIVNKEPPVIECSNGASIHHPYPYAYHPCDIESVVLVGDRTRGYKGRTPPYQYSTVGLTVKQAIIKVSLQKRRRKVPEAPVETARPRPPPTPLRVFANGDTHEDIRRDRLQHRPIVKPVGVSDRVLSMTTRSVAAAEWANCCFGGWFPAAVHWFASLCTQPISIVLEDG
jgi:hypothetical protein